MLLSLDVSTSITGYSIFDEKGTLVKVSHIDLRKKNDMFDKAVEVQHILKQIKTEYEINDIWIESSLNIFTKGKSSANTIATLSKFNGIVSFMCYEIFEKKPNFIGAVSARSRVGIKVPRGMKAKEKVAEWVQANLSSYEFHYKKTGKVKDYCLDECDSIVIGLAAFAEHGILTSVEQ